MPIEINYFAWEQWKSEYNGFPRFRHFLDAGFNNRIVNGLCVARLYTGLVNYELLAESSSHPISMILKISWLSDLEIQWDIKSIDPEHAEQFHQLLDTLPNPIPADIDIFPSEKDRETADYYLQLSERYNAKIFDSGWGYLNFMFENTRDYQLWKLKSIHIINLCEQLTGNKTLLKFKVEDQIEVYKNSFHKKLKSIKYNKRKEPKYIDNWHRLHVYRRLFDEFPDSEISNDYTIQLDYRHYLPSFLWLIAFQHETIDTMTVFKRIGKTHLVTWDQDEQDALREYFTALWNYVLTYYPPLGMNAYTFVHGVGLTGLDVTDYIKQWKAWLDDISASRHLAGYVRSLYEYYVKNSLSTFDTVPMILRRWLREIGAGDYFLKRYMEYEGVRPFADEYAEASDKLSLMINGGL